MSRWLGVLALVALCALAVVSAGGDADARAVATGRARDAYVAMERLVDTRANAWPYSQALWATYEAARVGAAPAADVKRRIAGLAVYDRGDGYAPIRGGRGGLFYDDNLWIALALDRANASPATVDRLFDLVASGWDSTSTDPCPGGVFWARDVPNTDRNAVTTANLALLALRLYGRTGNASLLAWARKAFGWTERCLMRSDGLVADHIRLDGSVDSTAWSYNQGAMIAAAVHLYLATHDTAYLRDAERRADAALDHFRNAPHEPAAFLAIFYRDLFELDEVDKSRTQDRDAVEAFASSAWQTKRDPKTGLFDFGDGPTLLDQAAMVQIYAELAARG